MVKNAVRAQAFSKVRAHRVSKVVCTTTF